MRFPGRLLSFLFPLLAAVMALSCSLAARAEAIPHVQVSFSLYEIRMTPQDPDGFYARFAVQYRWDPAEVPLFDPKNIVFYNSIRDLAVKEILPPDQSDQTASSKMQTASVLVSGYFKGYLDFQDFPFDSHDLPIVIFDSASNVGTYELTSAASLIHNTPTYETQLDGWTVEDVTFFNHSQAFRHPAPARKDFKAPVFGAFSIEVSRNQSALVMRLFIPILIIWLISYMGLFWDDSSPASRCGTAAIFAGITFALGTNFLNPPVNYLTVMNVVFLGLYTNIGLDFVMVTIRFWSRERKHQKTERFLWYCGVVACPIMMALTAILCVYLAENRDQVRSLAGPPQAQAVFPPPTLAGK